MKNPKLILASASPRRKEFLENLGLEFIVDPALEFQELMDSSLSPEELALKNAEGKAKEIASKYSQGLVIGVDTIGACDGEILEKPKDRQDAIRMITLLQGRKHQVISALCLIDASAGKLVSNTQTSIVEFHPLTLKEIEAYVDLGESMDKAAAYAIQGKAAIFVKGIEGDFFNVVGLPLPTLKNLLYEFDINLMDLVK